MKNAYYALSWFVNTRISVLVRRSEVFFLFYTLHIYFSKDLKDILSAMKI